MQKSIFFVTLPKSGTNFTWNVLSAVTGIPLPGWVTEGSLAGDMDEGMLDFSTYSTGDFSAQFLLAEQLQRTWEGGAVFGTHMPASTHNIRTLEQCGVDRLFVLMRDPRDATVSWAHHVRRAGAAHRRHISKFCHIPPQFYDWSDAEQMSFLVRTHLPQAVNWIESWLDCLAAEDRSLEILPLYYDELKQHPERYFQRIMEFCGVEGELSRVPKPQKGVLHYRKGTHGQWRTDFSEADQHFASTLMGDRMKAAFARAAEGLGRRFGLQDALAAGDTDRARHSVLRVLQAVPNDAGMLEMAGTLFAEVELAPQGEDADLFLYPLERLEQLRAVLA